MVRRKQVLFSLFPEDLETLKKIMEMEGIKKKSKTIRFLMKFYLSSKEKKE